MKSKSLIVFVSLCSVALLSCRHETEKSATEGSEPSKEALIARGKYLTTIGSCNDCHSPKVMTPHGPEPDTTRLLSGHPQDEPLAPPVKTKDWILFNNGLTAYIGPWGISYAANLTPDATGIGNWKFEQFLTAIRDGKSKGIESNRNLLPPMPWQMIRSMTDEDLKAVFTYLKSIPPVNNLVPAPVPPDKLQALTSAN